MLGRLVMQRRSRKSSIGFLQDTAKEWKILVMAATSTCSSLGDRHRALVMLSHAVTKCPQAWSSLMLLGA